MESFRSKQVEGKPLIKVGDVVIFKNDQTKQAFGKLSRVIECLTGQGGNIRGAKVAVTSPKGKPLEVTSYDLDNVNVDRGISSAPNRPISISALSEMQRL